MEGFYSYISLIICYVEIHVLVAILKTEIHRQCGGE